MILIVSVHFVVVVVVVVSSGSRIPDELRASKPNNRNRIGEEQRESMVKNSSKYLKIKRNTNQA